MILDDLTRCEVGLQTNQFPSKTHCSITCM